ncbi:MAG: head-tail adaptor protein [Pseudomonadota bacterium]
MTLPRLNRRLTLESPARLSDGAGGFVESWTALGVVWASLRARTGRETVTTGAPVSAVPYEVIVRAAPVGHPERPIPEQRFRDGNRLFHIRWVAEHDPNGRYLICLADEEVAI